MMIVKDLQLKKLEGAYWTFHKERKMYEDLVIKTLAQDAIQIQDACNASGIAHSLADVFVKLRECGITSTVILNRHPIVRMYIYKLMSLAGIWSADQRITDDFKIAYDMCKALSEGREGICVKH